MRIGIVGLGRMGGNIARRLMRSGHDCVVYDVDAKARAALAESGAHAASELAALVAALEAPRSVWVMVPAGPVATSLLRTLATLLSPGDCVIDGGNSHFKRTIELAAELATRQIELLDVGTSGGVFGLARGYCLMIGGKAETVARHAALFDALAPEPSSVPRTRALAAAQANTMPAERGWLHCGPSGSGHYVKMVHNAIEYGMMQSFAEGLALLQGANERSLPADSRFELDCGAISELWRRGSVITSWLLDLVADALAEDPACEGFSAEVGESGEGRWALEAALERRVSTPALAASLFTRFRSRQTDAFPDRLLSAMRAKFGGHQAPAKTG